MKKTKIVIDSTAYLSKEYVKEQDIKIVPLTVELEGEVYKEGFPGEYEQYFSKLQSSKSFPKTSQPSVGDFQKAYEEAFESGADQLLVMTFSSTLSGTYNSASLAAKSMSDKAIKVIDTLTAAGVFSFIVREAVKMVSEEPDLEKVEKHIKEIRANSNIDFTVESLEYLKRGGRLSSTQAVVAGVLNIKPVISLIDGELVGNGKFRGKKKALKEMVSRIPENPLHIGIHHIGNLEEALSLKAELSLKHDESKIFIEELGPVIGSHLGPGAIGICTVYKK